MKGWKKITIGGLGALTPIIINLLAVDLRVLLVDLSIIAVAGYLVRVVVLFYLGGLVAFLHRTEGNPVKIFELGIVAPALITSLMNAANIELPKAKPLPGSSPSASVLLISDAYAQATQEEAKSFLLPEETPIQQFMRGLTGTNPQDVWYVIVGTHEKFEDARKQVVKIGRENKELKPQIYAPYEDNRFFSVVIGANLTRKDALALQQKAIDAGLAKDAYLWTFPK